ncbi:LTA synthase family protein [Helicobacter anseris]|nr:alkaline phosphatase family protein [Helicobacter anseris]
MKTNRLSHLFLRTLYFLVFLSFIFVVARICFILYIGVYHKALFVLDSTSQAQNIFLQILQTLWGGFLYDNRIVAIFGILYFLISLCSLWKDGFLKAQKYFAYFTFLLIIFFSIANMTYYTIYDDVFNFILLGLFFDDTKAIMATGLSGDYFLSVKIVFLIALFVLTKYLYDFGIKKIDEKSQCKNIKLINWLCVPCLAFLMIFFANSTLSLRATSLDREVRIVQNDFLRKITPSVFRSLYLVYKGYKLSYKSSFASFTTSTPKEAAINFFGLKDSKNQDLDLSKLLEKTSSNSKESPKIQHIFYIISESLGTWAFDPFYDEIGLVSGLKSLVDNKNGFMIKTFFETAHGTIWSLESQITGLFYTNVPLYLRASSLKAMPVAIAHNIKQDGYLTRFYYGGSSTWRNLNNFSKSQGFDEVLDDSDFSYFANLRHYPKPMSNVWGVWDNIMFDFIEDYTAKNSQKTFNMIMTTTNHPPFDLPLEQFHIDIKKFDDFFAKKLPNTFWKPQDLAVLWWYDKQVTTFIKKMAKKYPNSLFVITGDHSNRAPKDMSFRSYREVPMILYSPVLSPKKISDVGSHLDIGATILELVSPKGFVYRSFGKPLFTNNLKIPFDKDRSFIGFEVVGTHRYLYTTQDEMIYLQMPKKDTDLQEARELMQKAQDAKALSWYLFSKDDLLIKE